MSGYLSEVVYYAIVLGYNQWESHYFSQRLNCSEALLVFKIGVDIGVIPQATRLISLLPPVANGIGSAVSATAMNQNRLHSFNLSFTTGHLSRLGVVEEDASPSLLLTPFLL
jgi:hypothetical protein